MRKIINISWALLLLFSAWSCSEDVMDDINKNVNNPTDVTSDLIITDVMVNSAFTVTSSDLAFYASLYIEHNVGVYNQFYNAEIRSGEPTSSTTYNNQWDAMYENLYNLKLIIEKCSAGGEEEGNYHTLGVAQILSAYNLAYLTDLYGDVPWSEALQPGVIFTPKLDKQEDLYKVIFKFLDDAIANLDKTSIYPSLGDQDVYYGGDVSLWKKFAYGLKARYTMRLSLKNPAYQDVIDFADQSFTSADEECQFNYNGSTSQNPFYRIFTDRDYFGASQSLHDKLVARNDPRDDIYFEAYPGTGELIFAPNGTPDQVQGTYGIPATDTATTPTLLLSYHELEFLKAEAYQRLGQKDHADSAMKAGIIAAFEKGNIGLTEAEAVDYYTNDVKPLFDSDPLSEIMNQKYLSFFEAEAVEAYNDYRRLEAMGNDVINLDNPKNATQFPLRYTYGADDVTTNANIRSAYGDGQYIYKENVWWAGGTR